MRKALLLLGIGLLAINYSVAQTSLNAGGGDFESANVTLSYSIGQVFHETTVLNEGVQLPYNIVEVVGIDDIDGIFLKISAYPNPTSDFLELRIETEDFDYNNVVYQISDSNGRLIKSGNILDFQTVVSMQNLSSGVYFLEVRTKNNTVKTFKIVKN